MPLPKTVQASVSDKMLAHVPSFFEASLFEVLTELFQNARRSGANQVDVVYRPAGNGSATLAVVDDGSGIPDPQILLAFGTSAWTSAEVRGEQPAGMGFAATASFGPAISSRAKGAQGFLVALDKDHFLGLKKAAVTPTDKAPSPSGTSICIIVEDDFQKVEDTAKQLANNFPLPVSLTRHQRGKAPQTEELKRVPFLVNTQDHETTEGFLIGASVYHRRDTDNYPGVKAHSLDLNLYGHLVSANLPFVEETNGRCWKAAAQATGPTLLKLVLPARRQVVQDDACTRLRTACYGVLYRSMETHRGTDIMLTPSDWKHAQSLGIQLPTPPARLRPWSPPSMPRPEPRPDWQTVPDEAFLMTPYTELTSPVAQTLAHALRQNDLASSVFRQQDGYDDCAWYQRLPKIRAITTFVRVNGYQKIYNPTLHHQLVSDGHPSIPSVQQCHLELRLDMPDGKTQFKRLDTDALLLDNVIAATSSDHHLSVDTLQDLIVRSYFWSDSCGEEYDDALDRFKRLALHDATLALKGEDEADRSHAECVLKETLPWLFASEHEVHITITNGTLNLDVQTRRP